MGPRTVLASAAVALASLVFSSTGNAQPSPSCSQKVTRATVVGCALATSLAIRSERLMMDAARGRDVAAGVLLPSNPTLSVTAGYPTSGGPDRVLNWSASLSQEIEIGGQRGARRDVARAELAAQAKRIAVVERETAAAALTAYFEALSARDQIAIADRLASIANALATSARERADQGLVSPVDAEVAYAASIRVVRARAEAERRAAAALAQLASTIGLDQTLGTAAVEGELVPLPVPHQSVSQLAEQAVAARGEIEIARAEGVASERRAALLRRARVPNPTLSAFIQNDSVNERVVGGGISLPIPLPGPLGRSNAGEVAEATALARRAAVERERLERGVRLDVTAAAQTMSSRQRELAAFDPKRLARAEDSLKALAEELSAGRLPVRDALVTQQALIELIQAHNEARLALCLASVNLARAAGIALERGAP